MIVLRTGAGLVLVTQADHAHLAAQFLSLRRLEGFPGHPRRDDLLFAAREHDNGWREADAVSRLDESGRPLDFRDAPQPLREEVWERGIRRHAEAHPYPARLIAEHGLAVHRDRTGVEWQPFQERLADLRDGLDEAIGPDATRVPDDYPYLAWADAAALASVGVWAEFDLGPGAGRLQGEDLHLHPFPFAGVTSFSLACRRIPDRRYGSTLDLASALAESRWSEMRLRARPW